MELASLFGRRKRNRATTLPEPLPPVWHDDEAELTRALPLPEPAIELEWWQTRYGQWRFAAEAEAMRRFPGFRAALGASGLLAWTGWLRSALPGGRRYLVRVTYPEYFPDEAPIVTIVKPELPQEVPHLLSGQQPCLYHAGHTDSYDAARTTAATLVAWAALWIHAFESWQRTGVWPGREA